VEALIAERTSDGTSVLWSTHDDAQARRVGSRIFAMRPDGGIDESQP
jgi:phosphate-transporting ATPase